MAVMNVFGIAEAYLEIAPVYRTIGHLVFSPHVARPSVTTSSITIVLAF